MTTSDERLQDAINLILEKQPNTKIDIMVTAPATGNLNYINWVKQQTVVPEFERSKTDKYAIASNTIAADGSSTKASASFIKK